jgi:hypothetical protein
LIRSFDRRNAKVRPAKTTAKPLMGTVQIRTRLLAAYSAEG